MAGTSTPWVGVIMGGKSDLEFLRPGIDILQELGIPHEVRIVSAHRTPDWMFQYAETAEARGLSVIIAAAGGAAHLPGMVAALTPLPVIGVPVPLKYLDGMDSLLSIVQMPAGVPVATVSIGGARNAGLLAARILGAADPVIRKRMSDFQAGLERMVAEKDDALRARLMG
jgi:5-(carboxyamino)imidazole ribonucleotide mutase